MYIPYTGVGSRETPEAELLLMRKLGKRFGELGFTLRSGAAQGADSAFEEGAMQAEGNREIFLPWRGFNGGRDGIVVSSVQQAKAFEVAKTVHPVWDRLTDPVKKLHSRNCFQVLGQDLDEPADFLLCWTRDGCEGRATRTSKSGGTATAIVLAENHGVPVFNMARPHWLEKLTELVERLKARKALGKNEMPKKVSP